MGIIKYYNNIKKQNSPLKFVISKFLIRTKLSKFLKIQRTYFKIQFYANSESSRLIWIDKKYVLDAEEFVMDYLKTDAVMIDVGSNIGLVTLSASIKVGKLGKVYSIEAHPIIFKNLLGNIKLNHLSNIHAINTALGDKNGKVVFSDIRSDSMNSIQIENENGLSVPISKLDDLTIKESLIALMKIDVEGYEKFVLEGGKNMLKNVMCVYFETIEKLYKKYHYTYKDVFKILKTEGFKIYREHNKIISLVENQLSEKDQNLIAIRDLNDFMNRTKYKI